MEEETHLDEEAGGEEDEESISDSIPDDENAAIEKFEQIYNRFVRELEESPEENRFIDNYKKLFDYLGTTRERSAQLEDAKAELSESLAFNESRLSDSVKLIDTDATRIERLKEDIDTSNQLIENAKAREQAAQEVISSLRKSIADLNYDIDVKNKMAQAELEENPQAAKHRESLEREKAKLISEVSKLNEKLNNALAYQEELERRTSLTDMRINDISTQLEETQEEVEKYKRNKEKLESDITDYSEEVEKKTEEVDHLREQMHMNQKLIVRYETQLKDQIHQAQKCFRELELWNGRYNKMHADFEYLTTETEELCRGNYQAIKELRDKEDLKIKLNIEVSKLTKERELLDRRTRLIEVDKMEMVIERNKLREVVASMQRDYEVQKEETAHNKELIDEHVKEKEMLNRNFLRQQAVARDHQKVMKVQDQTKKRLDREIDEHVIETRKQAKMIGDLEKERDRLMEDALDKSKRMEESMNEVKLQEIHLDDIKKQLLANDTKYRHKQGLFDAVRADRNALQRQMQQCNAENHDMREKLKINHRQYEQLKEGIGVKEGELIKEETIKRKIVKEKENVKVELDSSLDRMRSMKKQITEMFAEENRLGKVIEESERMTKEQAKMITTLVNERDCLGSQLVRRNDEISLVFEKINLINQTLFVGEAQYEARLDDIRLLKVEIKRLRQEGFLLRKSIGNMTDFRVQVFHLERELTKERMKSKALEDELHNPMNVHRWRRLSGSDPEMSELLLKTSQLQKRMLSQLVQQISLEKELREVESLYMNLRVLLTQQPGAQVQDNLNKAQKAVFANTIRNKCLVSELNMLEINNRQCNKNLARAMMQLRDVKEQLKHERRLHCNEKKTMARAKVLIERLKGAVEMPPKGQKYGQPFPPIQVSSMEIARRRAN